MPQTTVAKIEQCTIARRQAEQALQAARKKREEAQAALEAAHRVEGAAHAAFEKAANYERQALDGVEVPDVHDVKAAEVLQNLSDEEKAALKNQLASA